MVSLPIIFTEFLHVGFINLHIPSYKYLLYLGIPGFMPLVTKLFQLKIVSPNEKNPFFDELLVMLNARNNRITYQEVFSKSLPPLKCICVSISVPVLQL